MDSVSFVVVLVGSDLTQALKVFASRATAQAYGQKAFDDDECDSVVLYKVASSDARVAIEEVKAGRGERLQSLKGPLTQQEEDEAMETFLNTDAGIESLVRDMVKRQR